jgi:thermitase
MFLQMHSLFDLVKAALFNLLINQELSRRIHMIKSAVVASLIIGQSAFAAEYIVKLKEGAKLNQKSMHGIKINSEFSLKQGQFMVIDTDQKSVDSLKGMSEVAYIEPNYMYYASSVQDTDFDKQWGLKNTGRNSGTIFSPGKAGVDINALDAWKITKGSQEIKIAVIDTGVDYNHIDLKDNIMVNEAELNGLPGVDDDGNGLIDDVYGYDFANNDNDPMDEHGHGTHCAGVIGAVHNNTGIAGVMADVKILPIQFLTKSGGGTLEGAIKSIDYAIQRGVHIMSNSWGGRGQSQALKEAIEVAEQAGILFVAAAGNENNNNDVNATLPASIDVDNIVSVGAMDGKGKKASFSNYGVKKVHVFAPGVDIYSTVQGDKYKKMSGTSMACPHVAGIAGLIMANEPNLSYKEVKARLMSSTLPGEDLSKFSASGYVDAHKALK